LNKKLFGNQVGLRRIRLIVSAWYTTLLVCQTAKSEEIRANETSSNQSGSFDSLSIASIPISIGLIWIHRSQSVVFVCKKLCRSWDVNEVLYADGRSFCKGYSTAWIAHFHSRTSITFPLKLIRLWVPASRVLTMFIPSNNSLR
jgi:hypothetical protein